MKRLLTAALTAAIVLPAAVSYTPRPLLKPPAFT